MGTVTASRYCDDCSKHVLAVRQTPNHILHLLLTLVTCGLWGIIWIGVSIGADKTYRCPNCGASTFLAPEPTGRRRGRAVPAATARQEREMAQFASRLDHTSPDQPA